MSNYFIDLSPGKPDSIKQIKDELKKYILVNDINGFFTFFKNIYSELKERNLDISYLFIAISSLISGKNVSEEEKKSIDLFIAHNRDDFNIILQSGIENGYYSNSIIEKLPSGFYQNNDGFIPIFKSVFNQYHNLNFDTHFSISNSFKKIMDFLYQNTGDDYFNELFAFVCENKSEPFIFEYLSFLPLEQFRDINFIRNNWESIKASGIVKKIDETENINELKDIICLEIYHIDYKKMMQMYYQYLVSNKNQQLNSQLHFFEEILLSKTKDDLLMVLNNANSMKNVLEETYIQVYNFLQKDMKESYERESKMPSQLMMQEYKGINVCDISSNSFNLVIHNISASLHHKPDLSDVGFWEKDDIRGSITISCSEISERYLGHLTRSNNEVYFGFGNLDGNNVFYSVDYDSQIPTDAQEYEDLHSGDGGKRVFNASSLPNNSFHEYNEVVVNRYLDQTRQRKLLPSYIVVFDDENNETNYDSINEDSIRFAKHFNIPILYINVKKLVKENINEIINSLHSSNNAMELLQNINSVFSFIGGIKFSDIVRAIDKIDWYDEILKSVDSIISSGNLSEVELIPLLMIVEKIPDYKRGITSTFNGGIMPETLISKFDDFSDSITDRINNYMGCGNNLHEEKV